MTSTTITPTVLGLHHVTAITGKAQANINFYTQALGLRLVKLTVNFDDPSAYHLYYGDAVGSPGTILTFFVWPGGFRGRTGTGQVSHTAYAIPAGAAGYWEQRLAALQVPTARTTRFGQPVISFADPDGLALELIETPVSDPARAFAQGNVPAAFAVRGFQGVTLREAESAQAEQILVDRFGYRLKGEEGDRRRFVLGDGLPGQTVDVVSTGRREMAGGGAGQVHHVAFATSDDATQQSWLEQLGAVANVSPVMDRNYFHSIYFREPGGVLFEIATVNPGFLVDEPAESLGTHLKLPAWADRATVERRLPKLVLPNGQEVGHVVE